MSEQKRHSGQKKFLGVIENIDFFIKVFLTLSHILKNICLKLNKNRSKFDLSFLLTNKMNFNQRAIFKAQFFCS